MKQVRSKKEFFRLSQEMAFGNRLRQWSLLEYRHLLYGHLLYNPVHLHLDRVSVRNCLVGGDTRVQRYRLDPEDALEHCLELVDEGVVKEEDLILDESAPDHLVTLQAEVRNSERFIDIRYTFNSGKGMRQAYEIMKHASGLKAVTILKENMDAPSWDNLCDILQEYSDSVVELSSYSVPVGVLGLSTIVWEVRDY